MQTQVRKAIVYVRSAIVEPMDRQIAMCTDHAKLKGWTVLQVFQDSGVPSESGRPGMAALLQFVEENDIGPFTLVLGDYSRLGRDLEAVQKLQRRIEKLGGELYTVNGDDRAQQFQLDRVVEVFDDYVAMERKTRYLRRRRKS